MICVEVPGPEPWPPMVCGAQREIVGPVSGVGLEKWGTSTCRLTQLFLASGEWERGNQGHLPTVSSLNIWAPSAEAEGIRVGVSAH